MSRVYLPLILSLFLFQYHVFASLLIDYTAPGDATGIGSCQLEGAELGDRIDCPNNDPATKNKIYIRPGNDPAGRPALHFHRDPQYRRAEIKAKGDYAAGKKYFVGYEFRLENIHQHLTLFQWKKEDKSTGQNIPFNLQFTEVSDTRLSIGYTPPDTDQYKTIWTSSEKFQTKVAHHIALAWDTMSGGNSLQMWFDGKMVFQTSGLDLWTGATYPKFGIYRGEQGDHDDGQNTGNTFDSYIYRVQLSDASLDEVSGASGLTKGAKKVPAAANPSGPSDSTPTPTTMTKTRATMALQTPDPEKKGKSGP